MVSSGCVSLRSHAKKKLISKWTKANPFVSFERWHWVSSYQQSYTIHLPLHPKRDKCCQTYQRKTLKFNCTNLKHNIIPFVSFLGYESLLLRQVEIMYTTNK